ALALEAVQSASGRCPCCGQQLMRRPRIASLADRYLRGEHENQLLERFFSEEITAKTENGSSATWDTLMRPEFHTFHKSRTFHKELSESLAVLEEIQISCPQILEDAEHWHFLDLCCGKSLTSLVLSTRCPDLTVSALDRVGPEGIPHYKEAGLSVKIPPRCPASPAICGDAPRRWSDCTSVEISACARWNSLKSWNRFAFVSWYHAVCRI
ncbi:unnamed protein product, partial [Cladocopium goreaui]